MWALNYLERLVSNLTKKLAWARANLQVLTNEQ